MSNEMVKVTERNLIDQVSNRIADFVEEGSLVLPPNYSAENAVKNAYLVLSQTEGKGGVPVLQHCTKESIYQSVMEMTILGLNPIKKQCYFIPYDTKLTLMTSYFGKQTALKRVDGIGKINAQVIYENDEISYDINEYGMMCNVKHTQSFDNIDEKNIKGAYCVIEYKGEDYAFIRTMAQIQESWGGAKGKSTNANKTKFRGEFAKRTVINLAIKNFLQTSDDTDLMQETLITSDDQHYDMDKLDKVEEVKEEVENKANKQTISVGKKETPKEEPKVETPHNAETGEVIEETVVIDVEVSEKPKQEGLWDFDEPN